ncbi:MAG TPA: RecX family transcriptional regulator [Anaerolineales bacterium]|nr:RecX family transcriptional regulator [Anaerolineales bacterium]
MVSANSRSSWCGYAAVFFINMKQIITALQVQKKNPQRVNVFINGEFAFGLARIVAVWLKVGQALSETKITELKAQDENEKVLQRALHLISYRPRSEAEVQDRLKKYQIPEEMIQAVVTRLRETGILDDQKFAEAWIENRATFRPRSRLALRMELKQKGVNEETIEEALAHVNDEEQAYEAGQKKARQLRYKEEQEFKRKLFGFLSRRGFSYEVASPVIKTLWEEMNNE